MLWEYTATELIGMLHRKECSGKEIINDVSIRANDVQPLYNSYITLRSAADTASDTICKADECMTLSGIPVAVKDNISTKGIRTTCASRMLSDYVPPYDAFAVERLRLAGAYIIGKTNMDEFAMGSASDTGFFGAVRNPLDTNYSAGGSSGGSAAAVAGGAAVLALGTDTGGSVRQPASLCGIAGFCPSYGAVSRYGLISFASSLDRIGCMGRSVSDLKLLYNIINVRDSQDVTNFSKKYSAEENADIKGLRIGIVKEFSAASADSDVTAAVDAGIKLMELSGAVIKSVSVPSVSLAVKAYYIISSAEAASNLARYDGVRYGHRAENFKDLRDMFVRSRSEGFGEEVKRRIMLGTFVLSEGYAESYYKRAMAVRRQLCTEFDEVFRECDIIAAPVYPCAGIRLGEKTSSVKRYAADIFTVPSSMAGLPAVSVPCGKNSKGLPIGLQLIGGRYHDDRLLEAAEIFEILRGDDYGRA